MKKYMRILAILLILLVVFAGCDPDKNNDPEPAVDPAPIDDPVTDPDPQGPAIDDVEGLTKYVATSDSAILTFYALDDLSDRSNVGDNKNYYMGVFTNSASYEADASPYLDVVIWEIDKNYAKTAYGVSSYDDWLKYEWGSGYSKPTVEKNPYDLITIEETATAEYNDMYIYTVIYDGAQVGKWYEVQFTIFKNDVEKVLAELIRWTSLVTIEKNASSGGSGTVPSGDDSKKAQLWQDFLDGFVNNSYYVKDNDDDMAKFLESLGMEKISGYSDLNYRIYAQHSDMGGCTITFSGGNNSYTYNFSPDKLTNKVCDFYDLMPFGLGIFAGTPMDKILEICDITDSWFDNVSEDEKTFSNGNITAAWSYYNGYYYLRVAGQNGMIMFICDEDDGLIEFALEH